MEHVIVAGGSNGIGRQLVSDLSEAGYRVIVWDIRNPEDTAADFVRVDLAKGDDIKSAASQAPTTLSGFVYCAAVLRPVAIVSDDCLPDVMESFNVNVAGFIRSVQCLMDALISGKGSVVGITSAAADVVYPGALAYGMSKAALTRAIEQLAVELGSDGVRVNGVSPGAIETELTRDAWSDPEVARARLGPIALGQRGNPRAVSSVIQFLLSPVSGYITGEVVWVDGGLRLGMFREQVQDYIAQSGLDGP